MKKNNLVPLLGIAFVVAIIATGVFYGLFVGKLSSTAANGKTLVVAAKNLKTGVVLTAQDVKTIPWPAEQRPKGGYETTSQVIGSTLLEALAEGELVLASRLASRDGKTGAGVPPGMRAVSVHIADSSGVLALLRPGYKVDVQVVFGRNSLETEVRTALQDLTVLAVNLQPEQEQENKGVPVVTLLAKPPEADILAVADSAGRVRLSLRNPLDEEKPARGSLTLGTVMRGGSSR